MVEDAVMRDGKVLLLRKRLGYDEPADETEIEAGEYPGEPETESEDEADKIEQLAASIGAKLDVIAGRLAALPTPNIDMAPVGAAIARLEVVMREVALEPIVPERLDLSPVTASIASGHADLARAFGELVAVVKVMAKDISDMRRAASAPRHIITDINGNPTGVKIGD